MPPSKVVVIGGSAGAVEALHRLLLDLPAGFPAAICAVVHLSARAPSVLASVIGRRTKLDVRTAEHGQPLVAGTVFVAPPDRHLLVTRGHVAVTIDAKENRQRPAIDPLFRTAARVYGPNCIGVILSGALDDGSLGLLAVKEAGGIAVVQSPADAQIADMPRNAIARAPVDYALPLAEMGALLTRLVEAPVKEASLDHDPAPDPRTDGTVTALACPDCNGTLWEVKEGESLAFKCRVGHAYSLQNLIAALDENVERSLWTAVRVLEESAALSRRLANDASSRGHGRSAEYFRQRAEAAQRDATNVRRALENEVTLGGGVHESA